MTEWTPVEKRHLENCTAALRRAKRELDQLRDRLDRSEYSVINTALIIHEAALHTIQPAAGPALATGFRQFYRRKNEGDSVYFNALHCPDCTASLADKPEYVVEQYTNAGMPGMSYYYSCVSCGEKRAQALGLLVKGEES